MNIAPLPLINRLLTALNQQSVSKCLANGLTCIKLFGKLGEYGHFSIKTGKRVRR